MAKKIDVNGLDHYHDKVSAMLASEYSSSKTYAVGDYCFHAGTLYECTTAITTAEAWTSGHWTAAKLADDTSALKTALNGKVDYISKEEEATTEETKIVFSNDNKVIDAQGSMVTASGYAVSDYIDIEGITGIYRTGQTIKFTLWRYAFYDASYSLLSVAGGDTNYDIVTYNGKQVTWLTLNDNAKYVRITWDKSRDYDYYVVNPATQTTSYTLLPIIINGENIYNDCVDGKNAKVAVDAISENVSTNILNPSIFGKQGYYLDFSDGTTHITNSVNQITSEKIHIGLCPILYFRQSYSNISNNGVAVYCYASDGSYLGYVITSYSIVGSGTHIFSLPANTTDVIIYSNDGSVSGDQLCFSKIRLGAIEPYEAHTEIKDRAYFPLYGKRIANFGDSIFGNKRPPTDISTSLAQITGATVYNLGFGGCRMSQHANGWDAFSMYRLADAIATNDFTVQNAVDVDSVSGMPQYFKETRTLLESIDFNAVDIITISYGTNDFTEGVSLDNPNNLEDTTTFCGALRYSLETILAAYPQLHIFVCTPTWRFWIDTENDNAFLYDSDTHEINGKKLTDFVEAVQTVSKAYHVKSIDNYYDLGIDRYNRAHWFPANDGTHHNQDGGVLIAQHMVNEMF